MATKNYDLSKLLAPYKKGWVALNKEQTKVMEYQVGELIALYWFLKKD